MRSRAMLRSAAAALLAAAAACQGADAQKMRGMTSARQLAGGEQRLKVEVQYGAGRLTVEPATGDLLYRLAMRYNESRFQPVTTYDAASGRLRLGLESLRGRDRDNVRVGRGDHATVALTPQVPMDLSLQFGAGEAEVELGGLSLSSLELQTGASETTVSFSRPNRVPARLVKVSAGAAEVHLVKLGNTRAERFEFQGGLGEATLDFTGAWDRSARATVKMGVGSVTLRLPRGLGVRITKESFLTGFDAPGMVKRGNAWFSRDYDQARHKLDISIDAAIGSIEIDWVS